MASAFSPLRGALSSPKPAPAAAWARRGRRTSSLWRDPTQSLLTAAGGRGRSDDTGGFDERSFLARCDRVSSGAEEATLCGDSRRGGENVLSDGVGRCSPRSAPPQYAPRAP